ncbi:diguanylate cyclase [Candidatus Obscuribacterales bacterium]|nr:diguanylate cyclase [Candidatus Obscuribacterales bacterium]
MTDDDQSQSKGEFLDAIRRHICQILGFDFGFIDVSAGHEIKNVASFCFEDEADVAGEFVEALLDENKQPITTANTLVAQKVKETRRSWIGKAYSVEDIEQGLDEETEGFPYMIVPVLSNPSAGEGEVTGLIRVISFDASRDITSQDMMTLKLMGEHLASRTGLFGEFTASSKSLKSTDSKGDADNVLIVHSNRLVRRRFNRILGSSYHVLEAETSEKALETFESARVDVILVDSDLQGASGFGFCKVLKESTKWKHIPVILVVTENSTTARVEGLNVGADDCIPDSCFDAELLARVSSSLRHRKSERELAVQLQLLEDYAQRLEKAHEQLSIDRQDTIQRNSQLEQLRREGEVQRHQDNLLHRISNIIRKSFHIRENLEEMLEALSGWFSLDSTFIVMPNEAEPEDTIRVECVSDKAYKVVAYDRDLDIYEIFKKNFQADQAIISNDAASDRRLDPFHKILKSGFAIQSLFLIPITYEQKLQGLLVGYKCEAKANWSRINETFMKSVVDQVAVGVVNARLYATVQRQATTDGLTGLFNHRTGQEKLADQMKQAERYQRRISVIMLDVDHFKSINDTHGHPAGDTVLKSVAKLIRNSCRDVDIPVRYGGEEFLLVLPEVTQDGATVVAERIRVALKSEPIKHEDVEISITGSFGVASFPDDADSQQAMLDLADKALYLSKRMGRDQVHTAADLMFEPAPEQDKKTEDVAKDLRDGPFTPPVISEEARQHEELVPEVVDMVKSLAASLYAKSDYNKQHHLEVARMSELLAKVMGLSAQQVEQIRVAGLLHDVGVLQLPQELLHKEGQLTREEREQVNQHATLGAQMLRPVRALKDICEILENHHERWDGTGYPKGLKGENIPLPARIVAIVDSYHAMISERPYRPAMTHDEALRVLKDGAGKQWDPFLIEIFSAVMKSMRETTQEVQAKVALAATLARAGAEQSGAPGAQSGVPSAPQPVQAQPVQAQPVQAQPVQAQPVQAQPVQAQPVQAQPVQAQPVQAQPVQAQPVQAQPVQAQPVQAQPVQAQPSSPLEKSQEPHDGGVEFEQRTEPSKISSVIGPVIKPVSPPTSAASPAVAPGGFDGERTGTQSLLKFVEEATVATARSDEHTISQESAPVSIPAPVRVPLPIPDEPPMQAPNQAPPTRATQTNAPGEEKADYVPGLPEKRGFGIPGPSSSQPGSSQSAPAHVGPPLTASQGTGSQSNPPLTNSAQPLPGTTAMPPSQQSGSQGLSPAAGLNQTGAPSSPTTTGQLSGLVKPTSQNLAIPSGQHPNISAIQSTQNPMAPAPVAPPATQPGTASGTGYTAVPQHPGDPGVPTQPGTASGTGYAAVPQHPGAAGMPPQPGTVSGTGYAAVPQHPGAAGMPPQPGTASGTGYAAVPQQSGLPQQNSHRSPTGQHQAVQQGTQTPAGAPQNLPQAQVATGPLPPQNPNGPPGMPAGVQLGQPGTPDSQGYPRPYAAGQPVPVGGNQVSAPTPTQPQPQIQQSQMPPNMVQGQMPQHFGTNQSGSISQAQQPVQSTQVSNQVQTPHPTAQQTTAAPSAAQAVPPTAQQAAPAAAQAGAQAVQHSVPPTSQQAPQQRLSQGATATSKQPDTWDPYSDYDDEDEIEGGL